ncbi:MAG: M10 family metallopeptidase C-terminal domain-containing protein [Alphaproteobacteria bacterium]|nr:M10 family metallopeptidase C-terminal domain-containing protein [Alphaproteobacteria bacterium]
MRIVSTGTNMFTDTILWDTINGTSGRDMIEITWGNDTVNAGDGDDYIWDLDGEYAGAFPGNPGTHIWLASDDTINGGAGNDTVFAGLGSDRMDGGTGWDTVDYRYSDAAIYVDLVTGKGSGGSGSYSAGDSFVSIEEIRGSKFNDTIKGGGAEADLYGNDGNDILHGGSGITRMYGGEGNDTFVIGSWLNRVDGGNGVDTVSFYKLGNGVRIWNGNTSAEAVGTGAVAYYGVSSIENVIGTRHNDFVGENSANNVIQVYEGNDVVYAGLGRDVVMGGSGNDRLHGGYDNDILQGEAGIDALFGDNGNDQLFGGAETDYLNGGRGSDKMTGGSGADFFIFDAYAVKDGSNMDTITDFVRGVDKIDLSQIDAWFGLTGNQVFSFRVGGGIGTVSSHLDKGRTIVEAHVDGDRIADVTIAIDGLMTLTASDFIL